MNKYSLLNKIVLFIAQDYIYRTKNLGMNVPPILHRLEGSIKVFKQQNMFTVEEAKEVLLIAKSDEITAIMDKEVSFIIFVYELMKLWTTTVPKKYRPCLNIGDKQFAIGGRVFFREMIRMRQNDSEKYEIKKSVIDDSISVANEFFNFHVEKLNVER